MQLAVLAVLAIVGLWACSDQPRTSRGEVAASAIRDSAGIRIVENAAPSWTEEARWRVDRVPELVLETPERDPSFVLFEVGDIVSLSDGRFVVENRGSQELFVFDSLGTHLDTWGGRGEGPGEFRAMTGLYRCGGDSLVVWEIFRHTILDHAGRVVRTGMTDREAMGIGMGTPFLDYGVTPDCASLLFSWPDTSVVDPDLRTGRLGRRLVWLPLTGEAADTGQEMGTFFGPEYNTEPGAVLPFNLRPSWATDGERVFYGEGDEPEVEVLDRDGDLIRLVRWTAPRAPITEADWRAYRDEWEPYLEVDPTLAENILPPDLHPRDSMPLFAAGSFRIDSVAGLEVDRTGNLWVRKHYRLSFLTLRTEYRPPPPAQHWWVFDPEGRWLGEVETPENFRIREIGEDYLLGVSADDFDVEEIRRYRIQKPDGR